MNSVTNSILFLYERKTLDQSFLHTDVVPQSCFYDLHYSIYLQNQWKKGSGYPTLLAMLMLGRRKGSICN